MKTTAVLTRLLPTINAVRGSGAYNVVIASQAPIIAEDLRKAANDDRIVASDILAALSELASAGQFEQQQAAMQRISHLADKLLGDIAAGSAKTADVVPSTVGDIVARIAATATSLLDVFAPDAEAMRSLRADASELSAIVDAEVLERSRDDDDAVTAARIYDIADRIADGGYDARQRALADIVAHAKRIAA